VWRTGNARTLPLSATGSAGMEAAFVNTVRPGDVVVVAVNGLFGQRMCDVAARCGAEVIPVEHDWGQPVDVDRVLAAHPSPAVIAAVHAETSTGVRSDIAALGAGKGDALLVVDAVTSIGGIELRADDWGVDVGYAGTQKCLGVAPGLAPFTINDRAFDRRVEKPQSWYLDLGLLGGYVGEASAKGGGRTYHHTAPVAMVASLHAGLGRILDEGLEQVWARHEAAGRQLQDGLEKMGLELFAAEGHRLPELTTVKVPEGVDSAAVRRHLLERHDIEIGAGAGAYAASVWRIGLMGHNARPDAALLVLAALQDALDHA
jgi:alanine-glyoxylate transaminase/serine-glyoxylate transaminase/serine-pyruvate transaminase